MHASVVVPLSARTAEQLEQRARDLLAFIEQSEHPLDLRAIAWTLQVGREAMEERAAFVADSASDLAAKLRSFLDADAGGGDIHRGQVRQHKEAIAQLSTDPDFQESVDRWVADRELSKLAELWARGLEVEWRRLADAGGPPRLMSLPTYPFARERHWMTTAAPAAPTAPPAPAPASAIAPAPVLHPLVHANTSNLLQQRYVSTFTGREPFLEDGTTPGTRMLPPLLALEMMRAAVELAAPPQDTGGWELQSVVWGEPVVVRQGPVGIALYPRGDEAVDVEIHGVEDTDDRVHAQGHAVLSRLPAPERLDLALLKATLRVQADVLDAALDSLHVGDGQALAELRLPRRADEGVITQLLQRVAQLMGGVGHATAPLSLERLRVVLPVPEQAAVWLRRSACGAFDIDVCDAQGKVCVQMAGLRCESVARARWTRRRRRLPRSRTNRPRRLSSLHRRACSPLQPSGCSPPCRERSCSRRRRRRRAGSRSPRCRRSRPPCACCRACRCRRCRRQRRQRWC